MVSLSALLRQSFFPPSQFDSKFLVSRTRWIKLTQQSDEKTEGG